MTDPTKPSDRGAGRRKTLEVADLKVDIIDRGSPVEIVSSISMELSPGEMVGLVGESGSGKSVTALALMGLLPPALIRSSGSIRVDGREVADPQARMASRHDGLSMIFQNPMTSLNPSQHVGAQVAEAVRRHDATSNRQAARRRAVDLLDLVEIQAPAKTAKLYPHQCSGGIRQRVMIAIAIACNPKVLIADEPTTALDVTVQKGVMDLLDRLRHELNLSVLLISHDIALVGSRCDRLMVMYAGEIVEEGTTDTVLSNPRHPYLGALIQCLPDYALKTGILRPLPGRVPGPLEYPAGCRFAARCEFAQPECELVHPELEASVHGRADRCLRADQIDVFSSGSLSSEGWAD